MHSEHLSIFQIMLSSSLVVKGVLALLLFCSVLSWAIILKKRTLIKLAQKNNDSFARIYHETRDFEDIASKSRELGFSPFHKMFAEGYLELQKATQVVHTKKDASLREHFERFGLGLIERALERGVNKSNLELEANLSTLASIGAITPFIGLFGTVWGIINSFTGLAQGGATLDAVAPGIAEALVATAIGLAAAIPAVWAYNYFSGHNSRMQTEMETFGKDFINGVERKLMG